MKPLLVILEIFAAICASAGCAMQSSRWCAEYNEGAGATNCGFATFQQCLAAVSGIGGSCSPNPG